jgi:cytochrome c551/c552
MTAGGIVAAVGAVVLSVASIIGWGSSTSTSASGPAVRAELDGAALFRAKGCSTCHNGPDTRAQFDGFPDLSDVASFAGSRVPGMSAEDYVAQSIKEPQAFISPAFHGGVGPTTFMPTLDVSGAEIDALVAYLLHG